MHCLYLAIKLHVSQPNAIINLEIYRHLGSDPTLRPVCRFQRYSLIQQMSIEFELHDSHWYNLKYNRLPEEVYLEFHITLKPYLSWVDEAKSFLKNLDSSKTVVLALPDIEVNPQGRWNLPFIHTDPQRVRDMFPQPTPDSIPALGIEILADSQPDKIPSREMTPMENTKHISNPEK